MTDYSKIVAGEPPFKTLVDEVCEPLEQEIESLRHQLAKSQENELRSLAREKVLRETVMTWAKCCETSPTIRTESAIPYNALAMPSDSTALDSAIRQAKREALLDAAELCRRFAVREMVAAECADAIRRMAEELK